MNGIVDLAIQRAEDKLAAIIAREGDADGARRTTEYFGKLVDEELRALLISEMTFCRAKRNSATAITAIAEF